MGRRRKGKGDPRIYFIAAGGRIKIGYTKALASRMSAYRLHWPSDFESLGDIPGSLQFERAIHSHLHAHQITGEWFADIDVVRETIASLMARGPEAIGFVESATAVGRPKYVPEPWTPERQRRIWRGTIDLFWPSDPIGGFSDFAQVDRAVVLSWLDGSAEMPELVAYALAGKLMEYIGADLKKNSEDETA